jgi:hypothetical protein
VTARVVGGEVHGLFRGSESEARESALLQSPVLELASRQPRLEDVFIELAESKVQPREVQ